MKHYMNLLIAFLFGGILIFYTTNYTFKQYSPPGLNCAKYIRTIVNKYKLGPSIATYTSSLQGIPFDLLTVETIEKTIDSMEEDCQKQFYSVE